MIAWGGSCDPPPRRTCGTGPRLRLAHTGVKMKENERCGSGDTRPTRSNPRRAASLRAAVALSLMWAISGSPSALSDPGVVLRSFASRRRAAFCWRRSMSAFSRSRFAAVGLAFLAMRRLKHTPRTTRRDSVSIQVSHVGERARSTPLGLHLPRIRTRQIVDGDPRP